MTPWISQKRFTDFELDVYEEACRLVRSAPDFISPTDGRVYDEPCTVGPNNSYGAYVRCHELARGVLEQIQKRTHSIGWDPVVLDGRCFRVDHSWVAWRLPGRELVFLDVYVPGAVPQVQILDASPLVGRAEHYTVQPLERQDISRPVINRLLEHWSQLTEQTPSRDC